MVVKPPGVASRQSSNPPMIVTSWLLMLTVPTRYSPLSTSFVTQTSSAHSGSFALLMASWSDAVEQFAPRPDLPTVTTPKQPMQGPADAVDPTTAVSARATASAAPCARE